MKSHLQRIITRLDVFSLVIGILIGFAAGVYLINELVPDSAQLIRMYRLDQKSVSEDKAARDAARNSQTGSLQLDIRR